MNITGLTPAEAARRLRQHGPNEVVATKRLPALLVFLSKFTDPLILLLIGAAALSAFLGDAASLIIIAIIVLVSAVLDFANTYRSEQAADRLKERVRVEAEVLRGGRWTSLPLRDLVPGDLVKLAAGRLIPADGEVAEGNDLNANESSLTGESFPQAKVIGASLYLGSSIISGQGLMRVTHTGQQTKFAAIARSLQTADGQSEFDRELKAFSLLILKATLVLVVFIFAMNALFKGQFAESLLFSVALAVGLTPELLPLIITLNLTKGSLAMAKRGVIVKRLAAIQNFGSMDVLCTDKTGTLTEDKISLERYTDGFGAESETALLYGYLASVHTTGYESPLDNAIIGYRMFDILHYLKVKEIPFDFERKRESVIIFHDGQHELISKGAPEEILHSCHSYRDAHGKTQRLTDATTQQAAAQYEALSADGLRVLAVAVKPVKLQDDYGPADEQDMTLLGYLAFIDPAKFSAAKALARLADHGVTVKIVTGDNPLVTRKIASDIGLKLDGILTGAEMEKLTPTQFSQAVEHNTVFARVAPEQKLRIIQALRTNGHVVGYLGDGINDAPALKAADIGISVNNAVDVAKDTADLILLRKSLDILTHGVIEGRRTFANTLKYLMMALGSNFGNMFSMAGAALFLPFLPMKATQILLMNLLYDTSQFVLPLDRVDPDDLKRPRRLDIKALQKAMLVFGPVSSMFDFVTFAVLLGVFHLGEAGFQTGWFLESIVTETVVVFIIRTRRLPFIHSSPSPYLLASTLLTVVFGIYLALGPLGHYFGFVPLPTGALIAMAFVIPAYLVLVEFVKRQFFRRVQL